MTLHLIDLGNIVAIISGSTAGVMAFFQLLRTLFLDRLTTGLGSDQRDALYRVCVVAIQAALIVGMALLSGYGLSLTLLVSAVTVAVPMLGPVHFIYTGLQKSAPQVPEIDPAVYQQQPMPLPTPPTDSPQSAALDPAA